MARNNLDFVRSTASGQGAISVEVPAGTVAGDLLVIAIASDDADSPDISSGWTQAAGSPVTTSASGGSKLTVAYKIAVASEPAYTAADPGDHWVAQMVRITGDLASPIVVRGSVSRVATGEGLTPSMPGFSSAQCLAGDFILLCGGATTQLTSFPLNAPYFLDGGVTDEGFANFISTSLGTDSSVWMVSGFANVDGPSSTLNDTLNNRTSTLLALAIASADNAETGVETMELVAALDNAPGASIESMELVTALDNAPGASIESMELVTALDNAPGASIESMELVTVLVEPPPATGNSPLGFMGFVT